MKTILLVFLSAIISYGQSYEVELTPVNIDGLGGLQSYAVGVHNGEWLLVGGRLDGLHRRQPFASFSADGKNMDLIVVNPSENTVWRAPLSSLPVKISEQLSSTNMQAFQDADKLLCTGGYAFSPTVGDHVTFPYLTIIDLPQTIENIKNNTLNSSSFVQLENEIFRVTGGGLDKIEDVYHLVGGHKFMGRYNPMGPDHGPGFEQEYTNEIRRFRIIGEGDVSLELLDADHDEFHLHRRDYNLVPFINNGERELMLFSGVFQKNADLPYLYPVKITSEGHTAIEDFTQYFNHYHCPYLPIYDPEEGEMHTLFFGGIAQFYEEDGGLVQDNDVPFVSTIAEVHLNDSGNLTETKLAATMPGYLGAGAIFILAPSTQLIENDIVDGSTLNDEFQFIGHIYGGIRSSMPNIFWENTGQESEASQTIYRVSIRSVIDVASSKEIENREYVQFYPNPANRLVRMAIDIEQLQDLSITISDIHGKQVHTQNVGKDELVIGRNILVLDNVKVGYGAFFYKVQMGGKEIIRKVIWSE